jgi:hypothetical protein
MPLYTAPMCGVSSEIFCTVSSSISALGSFFSVAITTPFFALMPSDVAPAPTAFSAYSICTSLPDGLKVVRLKFAESVIAPPRRLAPGRRAQRN